MLRNKSIYKDDRAASFVNVIMKLNNALQRNIWEFKLLLKEWRDMAMAREPKPRLNLPLRLSVEVTMWWVGYRSRSYCVIWGSCGILWDSRKLQDFARSRKLCPFCETRVSADTKPPRWVWTFKAWGEYGRERKCIRTPVISNFYVTFVSESVVHLKYFWGGG